MTTTTEKKKHTDIFDNGVANRFHEFRVKYIDKGQEEAAKKLGVSQSWLSYAESGKRRIRLDVVETMVQKFHLNTEWLTTGRGPKQTKNPEKPTAASSLSGIATEVSIIRKTLEIFEANLAHAYTLIERQNLIIEDLKNQVEKLKKG